MRRWDASRQHSSLSRVDETEDASRRHVEWSTVRCSCPRRLQLCTGNLQNSSLLLPQLNYLLATSTAKQLTKKLWQQFAKPGVEMDRRMAELGGERILPIGLADDSKGLENIVEPWIGNLWEALARLRSPKQAVTEDPLESSITEDIPQLAISDATEIEPTEPLLQSLQQHEMCPLPPITKTLSFHGRIARSAPAEEMQGIPIALGKGDSMCSPLLATVTGAKLLTHPNNPDGDRQVWHMEFKLGELSYIPGDCVGIWCPNRPSMVDELLARLMYDPSKKLKITQADECAQSSCGLTDTLPEPLPLWRLLLWCYDLSAAPSRSVIRVLAEHTSEPKEKATLLLWSSKHKKEYNHNVLQPHMTLLRLLNCFPTCRPPLAALINVLPPMQPRMYSIASSPLVNPGMAAVAFSVVKDGHCTPWLSHICEETQAAQHNNGLGKAVEKIPVFIKRATTFTLPPDMRRPVVMVGPGTGVAPFRGFVQHRKSQSTQMTKIRQRISSRDDLAEAGSWGGIDLCEYTGGLTEDPLIDEKDECITRASELYMSGDMWLFFGCRHESCDFLYREEMEEAVEEDVLQKLSTAFSRDGTEKVYVQNRMVEHGQCLVRLLLKRNGYLFVCGDCQMARDVRKELQQIFMTHATMSEQDAADAISEMVKEDRFVMDTWSS